MAGSSFNAVSLTQTQVSMHTYICGNLVWHPLSTHYIH